MSVEWKAKIFIGIPMNKVDLSCVPEERVEELTDDFFICTNSWCHAPDQEFLGMEWIEVGEGEVVSIDDVPRCNIHNSKMELINDLRKYDIYADYDDVKMYLMNQVL